MFKKYLKFILPLSVFILFIFLVKPVFAGPWDVDEKILRGAAIVAEPILAFMIKVLVFVFIGNIFLDLSISWFIKIGNEQYTILNGLKEVTQKGWGFFTGMSNLFLIVIFLAIAFAFILKLESFQLKKALPRLILIAVLLNFSFVFVNVFIDSSLFLYNTVKFQDAIKLNKQLRTAFIAPGTTIGIYIMALVTLFVIAIVIPFGNAIFIVIFLTLFGILFFKLLISWFISSIFMWGLAIMFMIYTFLFAARIIFLQILTILSPLAFLSLALPQTKKLIWDKWLKTFVEWLFLGVLLLAFLNIAFGVLGKLGNPSAIGGTSPFLYHFLFVAVYLGGILLIAKQFLPAGAQAAIDTTKSLGKAFYGRVLKPAFKSTKPARDLAKTSVSQRVAKAASGLEGTTRKGKDKLSTKIFNKARERADDSRGWRMVDSLGNRQKEAMRQDIDKEKGTLTKIKDPNALLDEYRKAPDDASKIAALSTAMEKGGAFSKAFNDLAKKDKGFGKKLEEMTKIANGLGATSEAETIARGSIGRLDNDALARMGFALTPEEANKYGGVKEKIIATTKPSKVNELEKNWFKNEDGKEDKDVLNVITKHWSGEQVSAAIKEGQREFLSVFQSYLAGLAISNSGSKLPQINPTLKVYLESNAAQNLGLKLY